jgi:hypothetical protein
MCPLPYEKKQRSFEVLPRRTYSSSLTVNNGTPTVSPRELGLYSWETTTSRKNSNWVNFKRLEKRWSRDRNPGLTRSQETVKQILNREDLGSAFENVKRTCYWDGKTVSVDNVTTFPSRYTYTGPVFATTGQVFTADATAFPSIPLDLHDKMLMKGSTAIARTIPTNPVAGAAQFLGELRERLPSLPGQAFIRGHGNPSRLADEYLNLEFGLKPLVNDLQKFGEAVRTSNKVLEQLRRDAGRVIRRRYEFPEETSSKTTVTNNRVPFPPLRTGGTGGYGGDGTGSGQLTTTETETYRYWFSGAYTYAYQDSDRRVIDKMMRMEQDANRLFGLRLTPELVWELTPWSWAVDWIGNIGDVIHNVSAFSRDGLVMVYGYIMCEYTHRVDHTLVGPVFKDGTTGPFKQSFETKVKKRLKATPYGFGLDIDGFTPRQWAILGSLGITRGRGLL